MKSFKLFLIEAHAGRPGMKKMKSTIILMPSLKEWRKDDNAEGGPCISYTTALDGDMVKLWIQETPKGIVAKIFDKKGTATSEVGWSFVQPNGTIAMSQPSKFFKTVNDAYDAIREYFSVDNWERG